MSPRPARTTQADIARVLRAVAPIPTPMAVEVLPDGTIRITPYEPHRQAKSQPPVWHGEIRL